MQKFLIAAALCFCCATATADDVVVVLDDSGSMSDSFVSGVSKMNEAKKDLIKVLSQLPDDSKVGVVCMNVGWVYPLGKLDRSKLNEAVSQVGPTGGTPLGATMKIGADALLQLREQQKNYGRYRLLVITDGEENYPQMVDTYLPDILSRGILVDVIGIKMNAGHSLATKVQSYRNAADPASLERAIKAVFAETGAGGDSSEADFEVIAPVPNEIATAALKTLGTYQNQPIGEKPTVVTDESGAVIVTNNNVATTNISGDSNLSGIMWGTIISVGILVVMIIAGSIIKNL